MPKLIEKSDKGDIAKRRTVMILEVLSGRMTVSDAIEKAAISRGTYYQLETRALMAMLDALTPGEAKPGPASSPSKDLLAIEAKVERLEADKRRLERLLTMTKRVLQGPLKASGRKRRKTSSKRSCKSSSPSTVSSKGRKKSRPTSLTRVSTRTPSGEGEL